MWPTLAQCETYFRIKVNNIARTIAAYGSECVLHTQFEANSLYKL